jgi:predicted GNAT superfamily acetyltransferase
MNLNIRDIEDLGEMRAAEELQKEAWGIDDREVVPASQFVAARAAGGQLIGAWDGKTLAGFVYGIVGLDRGRMVHHSHLLAVKPSHRNHHIGYQLKLAQRDRVLAQGINAMNWTFDPLQSLNAHLNFHKLGVFSDSYKIDFYGPETAENLRGVGTDRLWVTWMLNGKRRAPGGEQLFIGVPRDINALTPREQSEWRLKTREQFTKALADGYIVVDFADGKYRLSREA